MVRPAICLVLLCLINFVGQAQSPTCTAHQIKDSLARYSEPSSHRAHLLAQLGFRLWLTDTDSSEVYGMEALKMAKRFNDLETQAFANRVIGVAHWARGNYPMGMSYLLDGLSLYQQLADSLGIANVTLNLGLIYHDQGQFASALEKYQLAYQSFDRLGRKDRMANTANHIGRAYQQTKKIELAQNYFLKAKELSFESNYRYGIATALSNMGSLHFDLGDWTQAKSYCLQSIKEQLLIPDYEGLSLNYWIIGNIFLKNSAFSDAEFWLLRGVEMAEKVKSKKNLSKIYLSLKEAHAGMNDYKKALEYQEMYSILKDTMHNTDKLRAIVALQNRHELEEQEKESLIQSQKINLLLQDQQIKKMWINLFAGGFLAILILGLIIYRHKNIQQTKERQLAKAMLENAHMKKEELRHQLSIKNKELTSYTLNFIQKNELMENLKANIMQLKQGADVALSDKINSILRMIEQSFHIDKDWEDFKTRFETVHQDFFVHLKNHCPELTNSELKLCALLKLNMNLKEAANILGISPDSVKTARYRLRKKLGLDKDENLVDFILNLEKQLIPQYEINPVSERA